MNPVHDADAVGKAKGTYTGRKPSLSPEQAAAVARRLTEGESAPALARKYGVSRATVYITHMRRARRCGYMHHEIPTAGIARRLNNDSFRLKPVHRLSSLRFARRAQGARSTRPE